MRSLILCVALLACACEERPEEWTRRDLVCDPAERQELVECTISLTRAGNPMSDEEGEDLVAMALAACQEALCIEKTSLCRRECLRCAIKCSVLP